MIYRWLYLRSTGKQAVSPFLHRQNSHNHTVKISLFYCSKNCTFLQSNLVLNITVRYNQGHRNRPNDQSFNLKAKNTCLSPIYNSQVMRNNTPILTRKTR